MADRNLELALRIKAMVDGAKSVEALADQLGALGEEAKQAEAPAEALGEHLKQVAADAKQADTELSAAAQAVADTGKAAKQADTPLENIDQNVKNLGGSATANSVQLQRMEEYLRQLARSAMEAETPLIEATNGIEQVGDSAEETDGKIEGMSTGMGSLADAFKLLAGLAVVQQFVEVNRTAESLRNTLTALTGSSEKAADEITWLTETSNRLGLELGAASKAYIELAAASRGTQLEGKATREIFESVIGAMTTMGRSGDEAKNALTAIAQMMGKGQIQAEELRGQLEEALPGATQALARALNLTVADLDDLATTSGVIASDALPALAQELKKTFGTGEDGAKTLTAQLARLQNAVTTVLTQIGETGGLVAFKEAAIGAAVGVSTLYGSLQMFGTFLGSVAGAIATFNIDPFNDSMELANQKVRAQVAAIAQYSDIIGPAFKEANQAAEGHAVAQDKAAQAAQRTEVQGEQTAGSMTKLLFAHQKAAEAAEQQKTKLDNLASTTAAFGKVQETAAQQTGSYVQQLQLAVTAAAQDEKIKQQQAVAAARLAADAQAYFESLKQQTTATAAAIDAAEKDALAKNAQADAAAAAALAASQQAVAVKAANEVILAQIEQQGLSAEQAKYRAAQLRDEYEKMRASGASLSELAVKMNEIVLAEDAARDAAKGYREERAMTAAVVAEYKAKLDAAKASNEGVTEAQLKYNAALGLYQQQQQTIIAQTERRNQLQDQARSADIAAVKAAADLAKARGDEAAATRLQILAGEQAVQQARERVTAGREELKLLQERLVAAQEKANADGILTQEEQAQIQTIQDLIAAKKNDNKETETGVVAAAAQVGAIRQSIAAQEAAAQAAREKAEADREAAAAAQKMKEAEEARQSASEAATTAMRTALAAVQALDGDTEKLTARFSELQRTTGNVATSMADWMSGTVGAVREVTQEYESQQGRLDALTETLQHFADTGEYTSEVQRAMATAAGDAGNQFSLLDQEDLGNLRAALDSANQKLRDMQQETEDARAKLAGLNAELLEAQGQDQKAELLRQQLDYETRLAEIEKQRHEAELLGNRDLVAILTQQEQVLRQINEAKVASIQADDKAEQAGDKVANSWSRAEAAVRSTGAALGEVHNLGQRVAEIDLSGLNTQMAGLASQADKLRSVL